MSEPRVNVEREEAGLVRSDATGRHDGFLQNQDPNDIPRHGQLGLPPASVLCSAEPSPSSAGEESGLLSLPWEMVTRIASYLPAQCVITVLPQVCRALGTVTKDSTAWQLRARSLTGSRASFPVVPRDGFDLPATCVEMEHLITCWAGQEDWDARKAERERGRERWEGGAGEPEATREEEGGAQAVEGGEAQAQEAGICPDEAREAAAPSDETGEREPEDAGPPFGARGGEGREERERRMTVRVSAADARPEGRRPRGGAPLERLSLRTCHGGVVSALLLGRDGAVCASGSRDGYVDLWDLRAEPEDMRARTLRSLRDPSDRAHHGWVRCLAARGAVLASGSSDTMVRLWDLEVGGPEMRLIRARATVLCLSFQTDMLLVGTYNKVGICDTRVEEPLVMSVRLHSDAVECLAEDGDYIISTSRDHTMIVYDRRAGKPLQELELSSYLCSMHYSDSQVWAGDNWGKLHTFSMSAGAFTPVSTFDVGHTSLVTGIHRSPGSLYTCSTDSTVKVHLPCGPPRTLCTLDHQAGVNGLSVKAGVLALASEAGCVEVWRPSK